MAIEIEKEDVEELKKWGLGLHKFQEQCYFCGHPTNTWHRLSNTPVCSNCAEIHDRSDMSRRDIARADPVSAM